MQLGDTASSDLLNELARRLLIDEIDSGDFTARFLKFIDACHPGVLRAVRDTWGAREMLEADTVADIGRVVRAFDLLSRLTRPLSSSDYAYALADAEALLSDTGMHTQRSRATDHLAGGMI